MKWNEWVQLKKIKKMLYKNKKGRRILFLDFDGVVNVHDPFDSEEYAKHIEEGNFEFFRPHLIHNVEKICKEFNMEIIVTSTWRYEGLEVCEELLRKEGLSEDVKLTGMTSVTGTIYGRENEIIAWLEEHRDVNCFLIVDDTPMSLLKKFAVQTDYMKGFDNTAYVEGRLCMKNNLIKFNGTI